MKGGDCFSTAEWETTGRMVWSSRTMVSYRATVDLIGVGRGDLRSGNALAVDDDCIGARIQIRHWHCRVPERRCQWERLARSADRVGHWVGWGCIAMTIASVLSCPTHTSDFVCKNERRRCASTGSPRSNLGARGLAGSLSRQGFALNLWACPPD